MASLIDPSKPTATAATTASVRANFTAAKNEIEALQATDLLKANIADPTLTGAVVAGSSLVWGTGIATFGLIVKRKTADESVTSSTTFQNDDHLSFAIAANEEWIAEVTLLMGTSLTTTAYKICFTTPAGATFRAWGHTLFTSSEQEISSGGSTSGTLFLGSTPVSGNSAEVKLYLWILNGATPGTVNLQWAPGINIGTALTVKRGSYMVAHRVA